MPCYFLSPPTTGKCQGLIGWHIDKGGFEDVTLDGLSVVLAADIPGHIVEVKWKVALYLDERADEAQKDALTKIFSGQVGGHMATLATFIGEMLGVKSAAIDFQVEGKRGSIRIADIADVEFEALEGQDGTEVTVTNQPLAVAPGEPLTVGKSKRNTYSDYGLRWEVSDRNVFYSPFAYQGS